MPKNTPKLSKKSMIEAVTAKHELAMWKVEQLWNKMPERDYRVRLNLIKAAMGLVEIGEEIKALAKMKVKKA